MTKNEIQNEAIELIKKHTRIAIQWPTGVGKSRCAINMINTIIDNSNNVPNILLVVAEIAHKNNWQDEFTKWGLKECNLTIECYASLKKYNNTIWDAIIFDEAHHLASDLRLEILQSIKAKRVILLSATLKDSLLYDLGNIFGRFKETKISLQQAIDYNLLPEPKIKLIPLTLDNTDPHCILVEEWGSKDLRQVYKCKYEDRWLFMRNKTKYPNMRLEIHCTELQKYNHLTEQFEYWKDRFMKSGQQYMKNKWLQIGSQRKRFLGELKTSYVFKLLQTLNDKRLICFCTSIEQAEILGGVNAIHSKNINAQKLISQFNNKKTNKLFAVGMCQEGVNLTDIEVGIIVQLDGQERAFIQKSGRVYRAEDPIQYIFYYKNTRDEEYLNKILEGINKDYIEEIHI